MNQKIEQIIARYLSGEASPEDLFTFENWLEKDQAHEEYFLNIKKYWNAEVSLDEVITSDNSISFDSLLTHIRRTGKRKRNATVWLVCANILTAAMLAGVIFYFSYNNAETKPIEYYYYTSGNGISDLSLPDGTQITLNKNSKLSYASTFGEDERQVSLQGEAYFNVTKDARKKFIVDMNNGTTISVLGTIFNVRNNSNESFVKTTLIEGSIRFETADQNVLLQPDQQLSYNKADKKMNIESADSELITAWKNNLIKYKSITFEEFVFLLEDYYKVKIIVSDTVLKKRKITGTFDANLSVEQILNIMENNLSYQWEKQNDQFIIK